MMDLVAGLGLLGLNFLLLLGVTLYHPRSSESAIVSPDHGAGSRFDTPSVSDD